ncbi:MAG: ABC transporter ATP-binding protein [Lentisphaeria bacterium]|nr:ABC transporter ATP-binding protein [Lentisphaeria bacterium]
MRIRVEDLTKRFGSNVALDKVTFEVPSGSVYGFVGPNGAGKTTAIRIMAGLEGPDSGTVLYDDLSAVEYPEKARRFVGFMPDTLADSKDIRVWEYLDFFARACGLAGKEKEKALIRAGELTNLDNLSGRFLCELSKGMKQQVSLARILLHEPSVLLLDEPAAGLDPRARAELRESLRSLAADGRTMLISSHILAELEDLVDGVVIIEKGKISACGELSEIRNRSASGECRALLTFSSDAASFAGKVEALCPGKSVKVHSPRQLLLILDSEEEYFSAMAKIFQAGLPVTALSRPDCGLEGVFMEKTKGEVQ